MTLSEWRSVYWSGLDGGHERPEGLGDVRVEGLVENLVFQVQRSAPREAQDEWRS